MCAHNTHFWHAGLVVLTLASIACGPDATPPVTVAPDAIVDVSPDVVAPECTTDTDCPASDACTTPVCLEGGVCGSVAMADYRPCDDDNACSIEDFCLGGACVAGPTVHCDFGNDCVETGCFPKVGCIFTPGEAKCDDGNPCTGGDDCTSGECAGVPNDSCSPCQNDAQCAEFDDGNPCNGRLACSGGACVIAPDTIVHCPTTSACQEQTCDPTTGRCLTRPANEGEVCVDGDSCTKGETCQSGECTPAEFRCECEEDADCASVTPNPCAGPAQCVAGRCGFATAGVDPCADTQKPCIDAACDPPSGGCVGFARADEAACSDDNLCTQIDRCAAGTCVGSDPMVCADVDPCTSDKCDPVLGCAFPPSGDLCDDGDPCTSGDICGEDGCVGAVIDGCGCGDGVCKIDESCGTCPQDCGNCSGPCCSPHGGFGCDEPSVESCVCTLDDDCCFTGWDGPCVAQAETFCGATCSGYCGDLLCDATSEDCASCAQDCGVCLSCGDGVCSSGESCVDCPADCGECTGTGGCCDVHAGGGCVDGTIASCVCATTGWCCTTTWGALCVNLAAACGAGCDTILTCGDGVCGGTEDCATCPTDCGACPVCGDGDCNAEEGCDDCAADCGPCTGICGDGFCSEDEVCGACIGDCGVCAGDGPCCTAHTKAGCSDLAVTECVCELSAPCCDPAVGWTLACANLATESCAWSCAAGCGDGVCAASETCKGCPDDCGACACDDDQEPDNTLSVATALDPDGERTGTLCDGDIDWYKFQVAPGGGGTFALTLDGVATGIKGFLFSPSGLVADSGTAFGGALGLNTPPGAEPGTWSVQVLPTGPSTLNYAARAPK